MDDYRDAHRALSGENEIEKGFDEKQMSLSTDNQHSCLKAYAVTLSDGCFNEARWYGLTWIGGGKKKKKVIVPRFKRIDARPDPDCNQCFCTRQRELRARLSCSLRGIDRAVFFGNWKRHSCGYYDISLVWSLE